jgi:hypothetical protein
MGSGRGKSRREQGRQWPPDSSELSITPEAVAPTLVMPLRMLAAWYSDTLLPAGDYADDVYDSCLLVLDADSDDSHMISDGEALRQEVLAEIQDMPFGNQHVDSLRLLNICYEGKNEANAADVDHFVNLGLLAAVDHGAGASTVGLTEKGSEQVSRAVAKTSS